VSKAQNWVDFAGGRRQLGDGRAQVNVNLPSISSRIGERCKTHELNNYTYSVVQNTCQINYALIHKTINFGDNKLNSLELIWYLRASSSFTFFCR
jgi:hypothetical protein